MAGIDSYVVFGSHFDGTNGATSSTDFSTAQAAKTITFAGDAALTTTSPKFGSASLGMTNGRITCADSTDFDFGTAAYTIDFWWNPSSQAINQCLLDCGGMDTSGVGFYQSDTGSLQIIANNSSVFGTLSPSLSTGTWYHFELDFDGTNYRFFKNGTQLGSSVATSPNINGSSGLSIGYGFNTYAVYTASGKFDEVRISKGIARHTANFTPETTAYSADTSSGNFLSFC